MGICNDDCNCEVEGDDGLVVSGIGTADDPFVVTPDDDHTVPLTTEWDLAKANVMQLYSVVAGAPVALTTTPLDIIETTIVLTSATPIVQVTLAVEFDCDGTTGNGEMGADLYLDGVSGKLGESAILAEESAATHATVVMVWHLTEPDLIVGNNVIHIAVYKSIAAGGAVAGVNTRINILVQDG